MINKIVYSFFIIYILTFREKASTIYGILSVAQMK